jgi:predicted Zn finger-like uncharacterized protein
MLLVCPNCSTSYEIKAASLGAAGRSVRCIRCHQVWFAANTAALGAIAQAHRADLAAMAGVSADGIPQPAPVTADTNSPGAADETAEVPGWDTPVPEPQSAPEQPPAVEAPAAAMSSEPPASEPVIAVADAPPLAPAEPDAHALPADPVAEDIETVAARRAAEEASRWRLRWPLSRWPTAALLLLVLDAALIGLRMQVVHRLPQTASLYAAIGMPVNVRGLTFNKIATAKDTHDGVQVLMVEGTIFNTTPRTADVPRLRFAVRDERGHEIYTWTARPARNDLAPGATLAFRSRLASPPPEAHDVLVRFFNRRDLIDSSE